MVFNDFNESSKYGYISIEFSGINFLHIKYFSELKQADDWGFIMDTFSYIDVNNRIVSTDNCVNISLILRIKCPPCFCVHNVLQM